MLHQEMNLGYFNYIHRPGEKLGVLDNASDFECCAERTHCNATHATLARPIVWDEEKGAYVLKDVDMTERLQAFNDTIRGKRHAILGGGDHNNVYFPRFTEYYERLPQALMQDPEGNYLELHDKDILGGAPIPMPAIDDPTLLKLNAQQLAEQAGSLAGCHYVIAYNPGGEMLWPEYFNLGNGDYRPTAWKHFSSWCRERGVEIPDKYATLADGTPARRNWLYYREQAMADRCAYYYQAVLGADNTHLVYYPTHGSMMHGVSRAQLSQQPDTLAAACDGIEMGHILIDDDSERRNVILTCLNCSYGAPVIVPRLGNKTPDLSAAGAGRSFTPATLRRLVYEDVGMGISAIYPIHWRSHLHDGEWFIKNTPAEAECRKVFDEIITASPYMTGMGRMQPQVGIFASDDTWLEGYQARWTALMQDMLADRANTTVMTDAIIDSELFRRMPLLIAVDDRLVAERTLRRMKDYLDHGGKLIVWGDFAETADAQTRAAVLEHTGCLVSKACANEKLRTFREMFLTGYYEGTSGTRYRFHDVNYGELKAEIAAFAPEVILQPFAVSGDAKAVNLYALTDTAAMGCVCINNGEEDATFSVAPDARLMQGAVPYDMLTGRKLDMPITVPGYGTAMIFFGEAVPEDAEDLYADAEDAYSRWKALGAEVGPMRHHFSGMRTGCHYAKRCAHAKAIMASLALRIGCELSENGDLTVAADALDAMGDKVSNARVWLRMTPGSMERFPMTWDGDKYVLRFDRERMPRLYDPEACDYKPISGPARLVIQAETDGAQGGCLVNVTL